MSLLLTLLPVSLVVVQVVLLVWAWGYEPLHGCGGAAGAAAAV